MPWCSWLNHLTWSQVPVLNDVHNGPSNSSQDVRGKGRDGTRRDEIGRDKRHSDEQEIFQRRLTTLVL